MSTTSWSSTEKGGRDKGSPVKGNLPKFKKKYWPIVSNILNEVIGATIFDLLIKALV